MSTPRLHDYGRVQLACGHWRDVKGNYSRGDGLCTACWRESPEGKRYNAEAQRKFRRELKEYEATH